MSIILILAVAAVLWAAVLLLAFALFSAAAREDAILARSRAREYDRGGTDG